jgi:hypothetical protein
VTWEQLLDGLEIEQRSVIRRRVKSPEVTVDKRSIKAAINGGADGPMGSGDRIRDDAVCRNYWAGSGWIDLSKDVDKSLPAGYSPMAFLQAFTFDGKGGGGGWISSNFGGVQWDAPMKWTYAGRL